MHSASKSRSLKSFEQMLTSSWLAILLWSCLLWSGPVASWSQAATPIVDTNGFETGFNLGALEGQDGWIKASFSPNGSTDPDTSSATIQSNVGESGSQGLRVDRAANFDSRWLKSVRGQGFPTHRFVLIDWDMKVMGTGAAAGVFGPFLGVDTYDDTGTLSVLGSLGVDATSGDVLYQDNGGELVESGFSVTFGEWNHFQIKLDFALDQYQILLNGTSLLNTGIAFADGPSETFTDADIAAFAASLDAGSQAQTATAYFDNFLVRDVSQADFDIDGDVDGTDLALWQNAFGSTLEADADLDGDSDGADFLTWQREFAQGAGPLAAPVSAIPEPSSLTLALLTLGLFLRSSLGLR